jgi:hypothetical protein
MSLKSERVEARNAMRALFWGKPILGITIWPVSFRSCVKKFWLEEHVFRGLGGTQPSIMERIKTGYQL